MFGLMSRKATARSLWHEHLGPYPKKLGDLTLYKDGDYQVAQMRIDQASEIRGLRLGNVMLHKRGGDGEELKFTFDNGLVMRFKFVAGRWYEHE